MTTLTRRILAAACLLALMGTPRLMTPTTHAHADLCTACADDDEPEMVLLRHTEVNR